MSYVTYAKIQLNKITSLKNPWFCQDSSQKKTIFKENCKDPSTINELLVEDIETNSNRDIKYSKKYVENLGRFYKWVKNIHLTRNYL